jgi:hypothetical protein
MVTQRRRFPRRTSPTSSGLLDGLFEEGFAPPSVETNGAKGAVIVVCHDEETQNWQSSNVSPLTVWEGSRLKMAGLEALLIDKRVVAAWFPCPAEDRGRYFQRLRGLNQGQYQPMGSALGSASIHLPSLHWRGRSGVRSAAWGGRNSPFSALN